MTTDFCLVVTQQVLDDLSAAPAGHGWLDLATVPSEDLAGVTGYTHGDHDQRRAIRGRELDLPEAHPLRRARIVRDSAVWYRGTADTPLSDLHQYLRRRPRSVYPSDAFRDLINQGWKSPPANGWIALVEDRSNEQTAWTTWWITNEGAQPLDTIVFDKRVHPNDVFNGLWPCDETRSANIAVIGVGSIGSAAAHALARYEPGTITLIDHDRLAPHNTARHTCGPRHIGRHKVDAVHSDLAERHPHLDVRAHRLNVISDANHLRSLLTHVDAVLCCVDGVAARQATAQLCAQANVDATFACVLEDGAIAEIVRSPTRSDIGCLQCLRRSLTMDPEPTLDLDYGTGTTHRPMTAIAGDLALVGQLAARTTISGILERSGFRDQRLVDTHLVIGLRPAGDYEQPFGVTRALEIATRPVPPPDPTCPICRSDDSYT